MKRRTSSRTTAAKAENERLPSTVVKSNRPTRSTRTAASYTPVPETPTPPTTPSTPTPTKTTKNKTKTPVKKISAKTLTKTPTKLVIKTSPVIQPKPAIKSTRSTRTEVKPEPKASKSSNVEPKGVLAEEGLFPAYEKESTYLCELFEKLIDKNHSNSILISGDAGKTTLVETCLSRFPLLADAQSPGTAVKSNRRTSAAAQRQVKAVVFRFDGYLHGKNEPSLLRQIGKRLNEFFDKDEQVFVDDLDETVLYFLADTENFPAKLLRNLSLWDSLPSNSPAP